MKKTTLFITQAAVIAALYVVLTVFINAFNLANGVIQFRISEALTILPFFCPPAVYGVSVGCLLSNLLMGNHPLDLIFGTLATVIGAILTYLIGVYFRKRDKKGGEYLAPLPPILANAFIIPFVLRYAYGAPDAIWFMVLTVGAGEVISCGILGVLLYKVMEKTGLTRGYNRQ